MNELNPAVSLTALRIKLYPYEASLLRVFLLKITVNVVELKGKAYNGYFVLTEWYVKYYLSRSISIEAGSAKMPKKVDVPVSVARFLVDEMTHTPIPIQLNIVLGQLHRQLTNRDLLPLL
jgi:hypothetical protein